MYQRLTGPTRPVRGSVEVGQIDVRYKLLRTHNSTDDAIMSITVADPGISGELLYRRYKSHDDWSAVPLGRDGDDLVVVIPQQPPAGKVVYQVSLIDGDGTRYPLTDEPVIIRFKGPVPLYVLMLHVAFMFSAILLSTRTGLEAVAGGKRCYSFTFVTVVLLFIGGLILGPIVQKYAFGAYWTGWPFGHDLTDTKTAFAMLFWVVALWRSRSVGKGRVWIVIAAVVTLAIYIIPHSAFGSELDYTKIDQVKSAV
ncbi:MAG: hypothetical protein ABIK83_03795 [Candidatus Zixiibacteriota bacterium]